MHEPFNEEREEFLDDDRLLNELFQSLQPVQDVEPVPGFYARVRNCIDAQNRPSVWSLFSDTLFAKRLSYASLTFLVLLGTYFVSTNESNLPLQSATPEAILAGSEQMQPVGNDPQRDRAVVLVNLASYQE